LNDFRKRKFFAGDLKNIDDIESPNSKLKYWIASKNEDENHVKKIKQLRLGNFRLKNEIKTMHLKYEKNLISNNCFSVLKVYFDLIYCKR